MNGVRSIFRRKGYLLTALAAAVLLAASSGTAYAQAADVFQVTLDKVTITTSSARVAEGSTLTITVRGEARVPAKVDAEGGNADDTPEEVAAGTGDDRSTNASERTAYVSLMLKEVDGTFGVSTRGDLDDQGQVRDANIVTNHRVRLLFGENTGTSERDRTATATATVQINDDPDAENEALSAGLAADDNGSVNVDAITLGGENVSGLTVTDAGFTITDTDSQTYVLDLKNTHTRTTPPIENNPIDVEISAKPPHYQGGARLTLLVRQDGDRASGYSALGDGSPTGSSMVAIGTVNPDVTMTGADAVITVDNTRDITISQNHDRANSGENGDGDRVTDTITLSAFAGAAGSGSMAAEPLDIDVLDLHGLPEPDAIIAMAKDMDGMEVMEIMEGGDSVYLTITVDRGTGASATTSEELTVNIRPADGTQVADYDLSLDRVVLEEQSSGKQSNDRDDMIKLSARPDEDVGAEKLTLSLEVSGEPKKGTETSSGMFEIDIVDGTTTKIEPKATEADYDAIKAVIKAAAGDDEELNPGETFMLMTSDLFKVEDGYTASYGVSVDGDSVSVSASSETITVNAVKAGDAVIVVTGTARMSSSSLEPSQTVSDVASLKFPVMVVDKDLVVTVAADPAEIMEGGTSTITATANRAIEAGDGPVEIDLEVVGDATLDANSIPIAAGAMSGSAMLTATEDDDYEDGRVTVIASGSGINGNMQIVIAVTDNDEAPVDPAPSNTIVPKAEGDAYPVITGAIEGAAGADGLNPGESFSVPASDLFTVTDGYTASYSASVDGDAATASASGDSVTVTAAAAGAAKVTITGTSKMASSSFLPEQVATNVADITFEVMVVDKPLAALVVTLGMPANVMDGNIVEGESYDIVVSANRMVTEDTEVMIMRDRAASDAGEDDFTVSSATIMAGYDSATAELMVTEDMLPDSGTNDNMGESLVLYGMAGDMETNSLTFTIWDQAVPSLPLLGQLLLALFLMLGGARLYRRRQG